MKTYFANLNPREQKMVLAAAFFVLLYLPYQFIYAPFQNNLVKLEVKSDRAMLDINWMKGTSVEIRKLRGSTGNAGRPRQSLLTLVEMTTKQHKLNKSLGKVQPAGSSNVKIWLNEVSFDRLMQWLDSLVNTHGLSIKELNVDKQSANGIVNARINMSIE